MSKIFSSKELSKEIKKLKKNGKKTALLHGVFDILHVGHINYFEEIKKFSDKLIVSVTSDKFVNKGPGRPMFHINERIKILSKIDLIDFIVISNSETAVKVIKDIKPNFYAKGKDYKIKKNDITKNIYKEIKAIKSVGGKFITTQTPMHSSTKIINEETNFLSEKLKDYLKNIAKENLKKNIFNYLNK